MKNYFLEGMALNASLILGLGAQNILVLNSGLRKQKPLLIALICSLCDVFLIAIGVIGAATFFLKYPLLKISIGSIGVLFLLIYAIQKIKEGLDKNNLPLENVETINSKKAISLALSLSLLNPHVYLDTIILVGGYATRYPIEEQRYAFGAGAATFSFIWFFGLVILCASLSPYLKSSAAMKRISLGSGLILSFLSIKLGFDVFNWIKDI